MRRILAAVALITATASASLSAQAASTGTSPVGTQDPNWLVSWTAGPYRPAGNSGGFHNAWVVSAVDGVWQPNSGGAQWISAWPEASGPFGAGDYNADTNEGLRYIYTYQLDFTSVLPGTLFFSAGWDNLFAKFTINGTDYSPDQILASATDRSVLNHFGFCRNGDGMLDSSDYPNCTAFFAAPGLIEGNNRIEFTMLGDGATDGLWFLDPPGSTLEENPVGVAPEPATMTLFGSGLAMMLGAAQRRRKKIAA